MVIKYANVLVSEDKCLMIIFLAISNLKIDNCGWFRARFRRIHFHEEKNADRDS